MSFPELTPQRFQQQLEDLIDYCKDVIVKNPNLSEEVCSPNMFTAVKQMLKSFPSETLVTTFIENTHCTWNDMLDANEENIENLREVVLQKIPIKIMEPITKLIVASEQELPNEVKLKILDKFRGLIVNSVQFIHERREPYFDSTKNRFFYRCRFFDDVNLQPYAQKCKIKLVFPKKLS